MAWTLDEPKRRCAGQSGHLRTSAFLTARSPARVHATSRQTRASCTVSQCVVPESRGALSRVEEDALWQGFYTAAPAQHREFEPSSKRRKRRPASALPAM